MSVSEDYRWAKAICAAATPFAVGAAFLVGGSVFGALLISVDPVLAGGAAALGGIGALFAISHGARTFPFRLEEAMARYGLELPSHPRPRASAARQPSSNAPS